MYICIDIVCFLLIPQPLSFGLSVWDICCFCTVVFSNGFCGKKPTTEMCASTLESFYVFGNELNLLVNLKSCLGLLRILHILFCSYILIIHFLITFDTSPANRQAAPGSTPAAVALTLRAVALTVRAASPSGPRQAAPGPPAVFAI